MPFSIPSYQALVKRFPLIPIRDDAHLDQALDVINGLLEKDHFIKLAGYFGISPAAFLP